MKACFYLQRNFAKIAHCLAVDFYKNHGAEVIGVMHSKKAEDFILAQNDIKYSKLVVERDIYKLAKKERIDLNFLKEIEDKYGIPNLWPYVLADRSIMMSWPKNEFSNQPSLNHYEILKLIQVCFKESISLLEKEKPDFILFPPVGAMPGYILSEVAKKMDIKTYILQITRLKNYVTLACDDFSGFTYANNDFRKKTSFKSITEAKKLISEFKSKPLNSYDWGKKLKSNNFLIFIMKEIKGALEHFISFYKEKKYEDPYEQKPIHYIMNRLLRTLRRLPIGKPQISKFQESEDYAFYPLHVDPELATMVLAPYYTDQISLIHNIAKSLPLGMKLYVKEHPHMAENRPRSYYKRLLQMPNVHLLAQHIPASKVMLGAKIVFTITGTAGLEASFLGKPVVTFGNVFYNELSFVEKVTEITKLPYIVKKLLDKNPHDEDELINFVAAIIDNSVDIRLHDLWQDMSPSEVSSSEDIANLTKFLLKYIDLK